MHIIFDKDGNPWGPFDTATEASSWATKRWPDQQQDPENQGDGGAGWNIVALRDPSER